MFYIIGIGSNEDGRNRVSGINEAIVEFDPDHRGSPHRLNAARGIKRHRWIFRQPANLDVRRQAHC